MIPDKQMHAPAKARVSAFDALVLRKIELALDLEDARRGAPSFEDEGSHRVCGLFRKEPFFHSWNFCISEVRLALLLGALRGYVTPRCDNKEN